jgi:hypothetical protein
MNNINMHLMYNKLFNNQYWNYAMNCFLKLTINKNVGRLLHIDPINQPSLEFFSLITYVGDSIIY